MPLESPVSLDYFTFSLLLANDWLALKINSVCLKCISGINLPPANKTFIFNFIFVLYSQNKIRPNMGIWVKVVFISKLLNNQLASCSSINLEFLQSHTASFDESIIYLFFVFLTLGFLLSIFISKLQTIQ